MSENQNRDRHSQILDEVVTLDVGKVGEERKLWCLVSYEYLQNFCYTCDLISHTDRSCETQLKKGEAQQFSRNLRFFQERRQSGEDASSRASG